MPQDERPQHDENLLPEDEDLSQMGEATDEDLKNLPDDEEDEDDLFDKEDEFEDDDEDELLLDDDEGEEL